MRSEFQRAIAHAEDQRDAEARIGVIKTAVLDEVRAADPAVTVRTTDYFNHSFAPDMVLTWPNGLRERLLYVRPSASPGRLLKDLETVARHRPMVFTLQDLTDRQQSESSAAKAVVTRLDQAANQSETWITDPSGIAAISTLRGNNPVVSLLSQALVRGGKGVTNSREVADFTTKARGGFEAAINQQAEPTRSAVNAIQRHLDTVQSGHLTRLLRAVWEGNGGSLSNFPSAVDVGALTDDDLTYLLGATDDAPREFWRRIGRTVTTEQLGRVRVQDPSPSLHALVSANLDNLQAKGLRVLAESIALGESEQVPRWMVSRGCLALRGLSWVAYLAARRTEELPQPEETGAPPVEALRRRSRSRNVSITRVELGRGNTAVTYESKDGTDVMLDPLFAKLTSDMPGASVETAAATLAGGGVVNLDLPRKSATGPTSSIFPAGQLVRSVLPLVVELSGQELQELARALAEVDPADTLFPDELFD